MNAWVTTTASSKHFSPNLRSQSPLTLLLYAFMDVCIRHQVPSGLRGQAHLKVWGNRHLTEGGYIFHNYTTVTVESKGTAVFIQTDKPIYKPKHKGSLIVHLVVNQLITE